jgi:hypothetical protein
LPGLVLETGLDLNFAFSEKGDENDMAAFIVDDHESEPASEPESEPEPTIVLHPVENPGAIDAPTSPFRDPDKPYREISWTVGKMKQQDVTVAWCSQTKAWMHIHAVKCVMNLERGDMANNLHMQIVSSHNMLESDLPALIDNYKRFLPAGRCVAMLQT